MAEDRTIQNLDGKATLAETQRACIQRQGRRRMQIKSIEMIRGEIEGEEGEKNVNQITYTDMRDKEDDILKDLLFIDLTDEEESKDAIEKAEDQEFEDIIEETKIFVNNQRTKIKVMGKKRE